MTFGGITISTIIDSLIGLALIVTTILFVANFIFHFKNKKKNKILLLSWLIALSLFLLNQLVHYLTPIFEYTQSPPPPPIPTRRINRIPDSPPDQISDEEPNIGKYYGSP